MFEFKVSRFDLMKYYNIIDNVGMKIPYVLHTGNEELFNLIKQISIVSVDKLNHYSLPIKLIDQLVDNNTWFADGVIITVSVDNDEIGLYVKMKYFPSGSQK